MATVLSGSSSGCSRPRRCATAAIVRPRAHRLRPAVVRPPSRASASPTSHGWHGHSTLPLSVIDCHSLGIYTLIVLSLLPFSVKMTMSPRITAPDHRVAHRPRRPRLPQVSLGGAGWNDRTGRFTPGLVLRVLCPFLQSDPKFLMQFSPWLFLGGHSSVNGGSPISLEALNCADCSVTGDH